MTITCNGKEVTLTPTGPYLAPKVCPFCGTPLVVEGKVTRCPNEECEGRAFQKLRNWVNKLDIKHLGDTLLRALYEDYGITNIVQLYQLPHDSWLSEVKLGSAGRLGTTMANKVLAEINKTRIITIDLLMGSLGIKFLGRSMAQHIGFDTTEEWLEATAEELATKDNMGINKAREMKDSIERARPIINSLVGVLTIMPCKKRVTASVASSSFCFTGCRPTAEDAEKMASLGFIEKSGVSAGLDFLVQKDPSKESSKSKKAKEVGCRVISLEEFRSML